MVRQQNFNSANLGSNPCGRMDYDKILEVCDKLEDLFNQGDFKLADFFISKTSMKDINLVASVLVNSYQYRYRLPARQRLLKRAIKKWGAHNFKDLDDDVKP